MNVKFVPVMALFPKQSVHNGIM